MPLCRHPCSFASRKTAGYLPHARKGCRCDGRIPGTGSLPPDGWTNWYGRLHAGPDRRPHGLIFPTFRLVELLLGKRAERQLTPSVCPSDFSAILGELLRLTGLRCPPQSHNYRVIRPHAGAMGSLPAAFLFQVIAPTQQTTVHILDFFEAPVL